MKAAKKNKTKSAVFGRRLLPMAAIAISGASHADQWEWEISADLSVVHTDNITLAADGLEESETVYLLAPTFALRNESGRVDADIRYRPEAFFYNENSDADEVFHVVDAQLTAALVEDALFVSLGASRFQTIEGSGTPFPTSNLPIAGGRIDSSNWSVRPYWAQQFGFGDVFMEYSHEESRYDEISEPISDPTFNRDNTVRSGALRVDNYSQQQGLAWGVDYQYVRVEYDQSTPWDYQSATLSLGYWVNETLRLFVDGGKESSYEDFLDPALADELYEVGFQYKPNARLDLEVAAGERSYGSSARANLSYRLRRGTLSFTYSEGPSSRAQIGSEYRPFSGSGTLDTYIDAPGEADRFVRKRGELVAEIELAKSDFTLRAYSEEREQRTSDIGDQLADEQLDGISASWSWRFGTKSTFSLSGDIATRDAPDTFGESDLTQFGVEYGYQLARTLRIIARAQQSEEDGEGSGSGREYTENQYWLTLRAEF